MKNISVALEVPLSVVVNKYIFLSQEDMVKFSSTLTNSHKIDFYE